MQQRRGILYSLMFALFIRSVHPYPVSFFFFNDTATTEIYTLSLHDALPIFHADPAPRLLGDRAGGREARLENQLDRILVDRKSTRLNSSHSQISYAVFCLKKKKNETQSSI